MIYTLIFPMRGILEHEIYWKCRSYQIRQSYRNHKNGWNSRN